jgi:fibronectin-binding autotransporter adhesin
MRRFWSRLLSWFRELRRTRVSSLNQGRPRSADRVPMVSQAPRRKRLQTTRCGRPLYRSPGIEFLEARQAVSTVMYDPGLHLLLISSTNFSSDDMDGVNIGHDAAGNLLVDGQIISNGAQNIAASAVSTITIQTGPGSFNANLSGIDNAFASLGALNYEVNQGSNIYVDFGNPGAAISGSDGGSGYIEYNFSGTVPITYIVGSGSGEATTLIGWSSSGLDTNILDGGPEGTATEVVGGGGAYVLNAGMGSNAIFDGGGSNVLNDAGGLNAIYTNGGTNVLNATSGQNMIDALGDGSGSFGYDSTGGGYNTLNVGRTALTGSGSGYNVTNNADGPVTLGINADSSGNVTMSLGDNNTYEGFSGPLTVGNANHLSIVKTGNGSQMLSGTNDYDGGTTIDAGTLVVGAPNALPENGTVYFNGGTLDLAGQSLDSTISLSGHGTIINSSTSAAGFAGSISGNFTVAGDGDIAVSGPVSGSGSLTVAGTGTVTLTHTNTFSGGTTITDGTLALGHDGAGNENTASLGAGAVTISGGQLRLGGSSGSVVNYSLANPITLDGGTIFANDGAQHLTGSLTVAAGGGTLEMQYAGKDVFLDGGITGTGPLAIDNQTPASGSGLGAVHFGSNGTNDYSGTLTINAPDGAVGLDGGLVQIDSNSALQDATVEMDGGHGVVFANGVTAPVFAALSGSGNINLATANNAAVALTVGNDDSSTLYAGVLSGPGSLTKTDASTLTLTGVSTFTGGTNVTGGSIRLSDNNHQILNPPPPGSTGIVPMDIGGDFNLTGITHVGDTFSGGLDGNGLAIVDSLLGSTVNWNNADFNLGPSEADDVVQAAGQDLNVTFGQYSQLELLAAAVGGNQPDQIFTVDYTDGSSDTFTQGITDWSASNGPAYGETVAVPMPYANNSAGGQTAGAYGIYGYKFNVDPTKTVSSISLPDNNQVMVLAVAGIAPGDTPTNLAATPATADTMHLSWTAPSGTISGYNIYRGQTPGGESTAPLNGSPLAADATTFDDTTVVPGNTYYYRVRALDAFASDEASAATPTSGALARVDLTSAFNRIGIISNGATYSSSGNMDGSGDALSADLLQPSISNFLLGPTGSNDVVRSTGQTINLPAGQFTQLRLLATAVNGSQTEQFTATYADGSSQVFTQSLSDWNAPQAFDGETVALSTDHVNMPTGGSQPGTYDIYSYAFNLTSFKTLASITLPENSNVIVLGITCQSANLLPSGGAVRVSSGGSLDLNGTEQEIGTLTGELHSHVWLGGGTMSEGQGNTTTFGGTIGGVGGRRQTGSIPTVVTPAQASPSPVVGTQAALSVLGADPEVAVPEWRLTYTWSATSVPAGAAQPTFSFNRSNDAKHTTATFSSAGDYVLQVVIANPTGGTATSYVPVTVSQTATTIALRRRPRRWLPGNRENSTSWFGINSATSASRVSPGRR